MSRILSTIDEEEAKPVFSARRQRVDLYDSDRTLREYSEAIDRLELMVEGSSETSMWLGEGSSITITNPSFSHNDFHVPSVHRDRATDR